MIEPVRWLAVLPLVAGCQLVFPLEGPDAALPDEDGDGIPDVDDLCPHIKGGSQTDDDKDGVGLACDPHPFDDAVLDRSLFFAFHGGDYDPSLLELIGTADALDEAIAIGDPAGEPTWLLTTEAFPANANTEIQIEVGFVIVSAGDTTYHEVGILASHLDETAQLRGRVCFAGYEPMVPGYLQTNFNDTLDDKLDGASSLDDHNAILRMKRVGLSGSCEIERDGFTYLSDTFNDPALVGGQLGVVTGQARVRVRYLWIYLHDG